MEEITTEILEINSSSRGIRSYKHKRNGSTCQGQRLLGSMKKDFRLYTTSTSFKFNYLYSNRRELEFKKSRLLRW